VIWDDDPFDLDSSAELVMATAAFLDDEEQACACACSCDRPVESPDDICQACREGRHAHRPEPGDPDRRR